MRIKPIGNNIFIEPKLFVPHGKRKSGIVVQETVRQGIPFQGTIIAIGPDVKPEFELKVGDKCIFQLSGSYKTHEFEGQDFCIAEPKEITAKLDEFVGDANNYAE